ncbi:MAG: DUF4252 domain-containing protein [Bacteroidetes bacterium]|nr:DUF4252 domain-containing protein [Bacteroidota bacterium]
MKRLFIAISVMLLAVSLSGQGSVDAIFSQYDGRDGYATVSISGSLLKLAAIIESSDEELNTLAKSVTGIRVLAREDDNNKREYGFFDAVMNAIDKSEYEEYMDINSSGTRAKVLVKARDEVFTEFLMVVGGDDSALIQIRGRMTAEDIRKFSSGMGENGGRIIINRF